MISTCWQHMLINRGMLRLDAGIGSASTLLEYSHHDEVALIRQIQVTAYIL